MTIDPRIGFYLNIVSAILGVLIGGTAYWETLFDAHTTAIVLAILGLILMSVNAVLHQIPSSAVGADPKKFLFGPKPNEGT